MKAFGLSVIALAMFVGFAHAGPGYVPKTYQGELKLTEEGVTEGLRLKGGCKDGKNTFENITLVINKSDILLDYVAVHYEGGRRTSFLNIDDSSYKENGYYKKGSRIKLNVPKGSRCINTIAVGANPLKRNRNGEANLVIWVVTNK